MQIIEFSLRIQCVLEARRGRFRGSFVGCIPFSPSSRLRRQQGATRQNPYGVHLSGTFIITLAGIADELHKKRLPVWGAFLVAKSANLILRLRCFLQLRRLRQRRCGRSERFECSRPSSSRVQRVSFRPSVRRYRPSNVGRGG